ncbi:unnamed protein product, partial [Didymodactylos carnosus]
GVACEYDVMYITKVEIQNENQIEYVVQAPCYIRIFGSKLLQTLAQGSPFDNNQLYANDFTTKQDVYAVIQEQNIRTTDTSTIDMDQASLFFQYSDAYPPADPDILQKFDVCRQNLTDEQKKTGHADEPIPRNLSKKFRLLLQFYKKYRHMNNELTAKTEASYEFRLSFSIIEAILTKSQSANQKLLNRIARIIYYKYLKIEAREFDKPKIPSYFVKTRVLWMCEIFDIGRDDKEHLAMKFIEYARQTLETGMSTLFH